MSFRSLSILFILLLFSLPAMAQVEFTESLIDDACIGAASIYCADLDDDDDLDIIVAENEGNRVIWYRNEGGEPIEWTRFLIRAGMVGAHSVHANDIDRDDDLDVIATTYGSSIYWFSNDGGDPITWTSHTITSSFSQAHEVYTIDIDDDDDIDVLGAASGANQIKLWLNNGDDPVTWTEQLIDNACGMAKSVHAKDVNGDGLIDILSAGIQDNDVYWYENDGQIPITWTSHPIDVNYLGAHRVEGVDLNDDGHLDVLGAAYIGNYCTWWKNDGEDPIGWTEQTIVSGFDDACVVQAADIDGDGILDVVGTAQGDNTISWFRNDGEDPITWTRFDIVTDFDRPWPLYVCDIDDDGDNDILSASSYNSIDELRLWYNDGSGAFVSESYAFLPELDCLVYPNPFNGQAELSITLPTRSELTINLYDVQGRLVQTVMSGVYPAGEHAFHLRGDQLPSGIYFASLTTDHRQQVRKLTLLK